MIGWIIKTKNTTYKLFRGSLTAYEDGVYHLQAISTPRTLTSLSNHFLTPVLVRPNWSGIPPEVGGYFTFASTGSGWPEALGAEPVICTSRVSSIIEL